MNNKGAMLSEITNVRLVHAITAIDFPSNDVGLLNFELLMDVFFIATLFCFCKSLFVE